MTNRVGVRQRAHRVFSVLLVPVLALGIQFLRVGDAAADPASSANFHLTSQTFANLGGSSASTSFMLTACLAPDLGSAGLSTSTSFRLIAGCTAAFVPQVCGDGILEGTEECDDGNTVDGDCCSSTCQIESSSTVCRPSTGECDPAEHCTGTSPSCPADVVKSFGASCTPDSNVCTRDICNGVTGTCTHPTDTSPACTPLFTTGVNEGSTTITGFSNPGCTGGHIEIRDCGGPDQPPICFNGNDVVIGTATKLANGTFKVTIPQLMIGQKIYIADTCSMPPLFSAVLMIPEPHSAPAMSPAMMLVLGLALAGLAALRFRVRRRRS